MKYYINDNLEPLTNDELLKQLETVSEQRRSKVLKFRFDSGRLQSLRAYQLLQKAMKEEYGITTPPVFTEGEHGKPCIEGCEDIHFNLSHCNNAVACVVSNTPVGIDVESIKDKIKEDLVRYVFSEKEQSMIYNAKGTDEHGHLLTPEIMFTRLWTMKEALVKLTGTGISGKEQLVPLLNDWHEKTSNYDFITIQSMENKWVCSVCFYKK